MINKYYAQALTLTVVFTSISTSVYAAGFRLPEYSAYGIATSNAIVARDDAAVLSLNPAAMAFLQDNQVTANLYNLKYDLEVTTTANNQTTQNAGEDTFFVPGLYVMSQLSTNWSAGLSVHIPFGLETKWPDNTFPSFGGVNSLDPELSKIKMINYNPNIAYKIDNNTSVAFGIDYYEVSELNFNTHAVTIFGTGDGLGWNAALQSHHGPVSVGLSYHHSVGTKLDGNLNTTAVRANLNFPSMFQLGVHYQVTDSIGFEVDYERTGWSSFSTLEIINSNSGSAQTTSSNNWRDTNTYRSNLQIKLNNNSELNFGLAFDETPQSDEYYSARIADSDRILYSLGYRHRFEKLSIDVGYMRVEFKERNFNASKTYSFPTGEPNGTNAYNGTYRAHADLFGLGVNYAF